MKKSPGRSELAASGGQAAVRAFGVAAMAAAAALVVALAVRPIGGHDVGYHLAYGEHFLDHGRIVQTNRFIYTRLDKDVLADPKNVGAGCRYDPASNTYHFVNANWLSQVVLAAVHRAGGMVALSVLQAAMVAGIFALLVVTMRRAGLGWHWIAPAVILAALTAHERFALRPEVFGFLILSGQFALLAGPGMGWRRAAGVVGLQVLAVNCHGYFLLGVALAAAMLLDALGRWLWASTVTESEAGAVKARLKWLAVATGGAVLASLCNPWFVRGAIMPVQALAAIQRGRFELTIVAESRRQVVQITELSSPFLAQWRGMLSTKAYMVTLCVGAVGLLAALAGRRWGWALILIGMAAASMKMRRNMVLAGIVVAPLSAMAIRDGWCRLRQRLRPGRPGWLASAAAVAVSLAVMAAAAFWVHRTVTHKLYFAERSRGRFRLGMMEVSLPLAAAEWINTNRPAGNVFCDFSTSANLMYFTRPHRQVPLLTNTWAYPHYVRQWVLDCTADPEALERAVEAYEVETIVLNPSPIGRDVVRYLADSPRWAVVEVDGKYVTFLRRDGANAALARAQEITEANLNVARHVEQIARTDPVPAHALHTGALILYWMGWLAPAEAMWDECVRLEPDFHEAIYFLGLCWARRGGVANLAKAAGLIERALEIEPDYPEASNDLRLVRRRLAALQLEERRGRGP